MAAKHSRVLGQPSGARVETLMARPSIPSPQLFVLGALVSDSVASLHSVEACLFLLTFMLL